MDAYSGMGWRVPELRERFRTSNDVYFDAVSRVRLDTWSRGRTVLIGDAASCVSLLGEGSSKAIIGAATLAQALTAHPDDPAAAFRRFTVNDYGGASVASRSRRICSSPRPDSEPPPAIAHSGCGRPSPPAGAAGRADEEREAGCGPSSVHVRGGRLPGWLPPLSRAGRLQALRASASRWVRRCVRCLWTG
jgi:hypothetical protein